MCYKPSADRAVACGGGARETLEESAVHCGFGEHVCFTGESDRIPALQRAMDVLAVSSLSEGLGIVALEAQASGLPVICSSGVLEEVRGAVKNSPFGE